MNFKQLSKWVLGAALCAGFSAKASVWEEKNQWSADWESKYSQWIKTTYNEDFFTTGAWAGVSTDCADAVYFSRLIFSYENSLPFQIVDHTGGTKYITNKMSRWDNLPNTKDRVKKMMAWMMDIVSTQTLFVDTYPIAINRTYVTPGKVWVRPSLQISGQGLGQIFERIGTFLSGKSSNPDPGHAEVVKEVTESGIVYLIGSTVPATVRKLTLASSFKIMPDNQQLGLRAWKEPQHYGAAKEQQPGYSVEQYTMGVVPVSQNNSGDGGFTNSIQAPTQKTYAEWSKQVHERLALRSETKDEKIRRLATELCSLAQSRVEVVRDSELYKKAIGGGCMDADGYESFSTPSRDKRIYDTLSDLSKAASGNLFFGARLESTAVKKALAACGDLEIAEGKKLSMSAYAKNISNDMISSDPNVSLSARWGITKEKSNCPVPKN